MDTELKSLEQKLTQLLGFCHRLRQENHSLRQELVSEQNHSKHLHEKLSVAKDKLEQLIDRIPEK